MSDRLGLALSFARHTVRAMTWSPVFAGAAVAAAVAWLRTRDPCGAIETSCLTLETRVEALRLAGGVIAVGIGFLLDDPAEETTAAAPLQRWVVRCGRVAIALPLVSAVWGACVWIARSAGIDPQGLPAGALTIEFAALATTALAASGMAAHRLPDHRGGIAAGPALLLLATIGLLLPDEIRLFVDGPQDQSWKGAHVAWAALLTLAGAAFAWSSQDAGSTVLHSVRSVRGRRRPEVRPVPPTAKR